jgi:hypothetical protein
MREMKRQNILLQSKLKLLEEEIETLNGRIEITAKERNKYRKEIQMSLLNSNASSNNYCNSEPISSSDTNRSVSISRPILLSKAESFRSNSLISSTKYWNDLTNRSTSSWDVNYNTGCLNKFMKPLGMELNVNSSVSKNCTRAFNSNLSNGGGSIATDINSASSTPRSFR